MAKEFDDFLMDLLKITGWNFSFLTGIAFPRPFVWRNYISLGQWKYDFFTQKYVEMPHLYKGMLYTSVYEGQSYNITKYSLVIHETSDLKTKFI